jgi:hypothetical protein
MQWISVKDKLPEKYALVLATDGKKIHIAQIDSTSIDSARIVHDNCAYWCQVNYATHWMPLPRCPANE